jgi:hypothetical protein
MSRKRASTETTEKEEAPGGGKCEHDLTSVRLRVLRG